jgi:hypothetical protein
VKQFENVTASYRVMMTLAQYHPGCRNDSGNRQDQLMSDDFDIEPNMDQSNLAALVLSQELDSLTDVLVSSLREVLSILDDNYQCPDTVH